MKDFPKPTDKRPQLTLPSKSALVALLEEREALLTRRGEELADQEKLLQEEKEKLEARRHEVENRFRAMTEGELLLKNQKLLYQKQFSSLMEQDDLVALRTELERREDDLHKKETYFTQTEMRLNEQLSAREQELIKREAWVSAEHEKATANQTRRLQAIVFTDVVSFSALMQADENLTIKKVRADLQRMRTEGQAQGGMVINTMGDGILMIFPSAIQAVRYSLGMQKTLNQTSGPNGMQHRIGIHIADVALLSDGGIAGDGVNIASRLESQAPNGGVCISAIVYLLVKGKLTLPPSSVEQLELKNIAEPVAVYKYTSDAIGHMADHVGTLPPQMEAEEERSASPFPPALPDASGGNKGPGGAPGAR